MRPFFRNHASRIPAIAVERSDSGSELTLPSSDLVAQHPEITVIVLECGNLPPYADAISAATGRPVQSILDGVRLFT